MTTLLPRTVLAVPASSERFLHKARTSTASALMVDLEDGVTATSKDEARALIRTSARPLTSARRRLWLRVNAAGSPHLAADLDLANAQREHLDALVLPKATPDAVHEIATRTDLPLVALVESPEGVEDARAITAHPAVRAVMFGELDYRAELAAAGGLHAQDTSWAQARIVNAAACAAIPAIAGPTAAVDDEHRLQTDCRRQSDLGFTGKLCIHPAQLEHALRAFAPSDDMTAWARRVTAAVADAPADGAIAVDGAMVDKPVVDRARRILAEGQQ
ncbi:HpcH/HpaI aldolase/citrate lyase family protein [Streptomyces himalayensis]|uniref:CoA ester lyase n=1 Tax=Streptomyces himalayensis subsp. himalayensis TaxID=2756131 RepID=A0A7W0DS27_9ACTN|nr:aldolase/citrate lyase family protein [Streptomyces himalayensis]MBA2950232.1 CoA ester lyase [Streptomyces himalayensis subsp. himalayensis]